MKILGLLLALTVATYAGAQENNAVTKAKLQKSSTKRVNATANTATPAIETGSTAVSASEIMSELKQPTNNAALSLFNYYPAAGAKALKFTPVLSNGNIGSSVKDVTSSTQTSSFLTEINFQTQMNDKWALEVANSFGSENFSTTSRVKGTTQNFKQEARNSGLGDFHVTAKTMKAQAAGNLQLAADLGLSMTASEQGTSSTDGNRSSGGAQVTPSLAYEQLYKDRVIGWKASFNIKSERAVESRTTVGEPKTKYTLNGGNALSGLAFTEWQNKKNLIGLRGGLSFVSEETAQVSGQRPQTSDSFQLINAGIYGESALNNKVMLVPSLTFTSLFNRGTGTVDTYDVLSIGLGARIAL